MAIEEVLYIPQNRKAGALPLDGLMSYLEHLIEVGGLAALQRSSLYILQPEPTEFP